MKDLFSEQDYTETINRINELAPSTKAQWGTMTVNQMLAHCSEVQEVMNGSKPLKGTPFIIKLIKGMIRRGVFNETPYKRNSPTHPQYVVKNEEEFEKQKLRLLASLNQMKNETQEQSSQVSHALFGKMTREERGWGCHKHLNHHLEQFGV